MRRLSLQTRKEILSLFLRTSTKRMVEVNKIEKNNNDNKCYACIRAFLDSLEKKQKQDII